MAALESKELVTTASGLQYRDIVVGSGPSPPVGFQVRHIYPQAKIASLCKLLYLIVVCVYG
jgi:hypothetical protein